MLHSATGEFQHCLGWEQRHNERRDCRVTEDSGHHWCSAGSVEVDTGSLPSQDGFICLLALTCGVYLLFNSVGLQILSHLLVNPSRAVECKCSCLWCIRGTVTVQAFFPEAKVIFPNLITREVDFRRGKDHDRAHLLFLSSWHTHSQITLPGTFPWASRRGEDFFFIFKSEKKVREQLVCTN